MREQSCGDRRNESGAIDIPAIATNLMPGEDDVWLSKTAKAISYPQDGNRQLLKIEADSFWFRHRNHCICEIVNKFPPHGAIFDIGGGNGFVSLGLKESGFPTVLVEPGREGASNARERGLSPVVCATLEEAGFREHSLPSAGLFDVIEHIEDDVQFLKTIRKLMREDGRLYLTVPAYNFLWSQDDACAGHFRRYTLTGLRRKLRDAGFDVEYGTYMFTFLPVAILAFRTIPSRLGMRKGNVIEGYEREHKTGSGIMSRLLEAYLQAELFVIKRGLLPAGGTCLVAAKPSRRQS